jgi:hypothetical protein
MSRFLSSKTAEHFNQPRGIAEKLFLLLSQIGGGEKKRR